KRENVLGLPDAMRAVNRLRLDGRVPPGIEQEDVVGTGQVQADAARLKADQEELAGWIRLKLFHARLAIARFAVQVRIANLLLVQLFLHQRQHARELGKDQCLVTLGGDFAKL